MTMTYVDIAPVEAPDPKPVYSKLKPSVKKAWLEALRSGEYSQTRGKLCSTRGSMCCLGVAYDTCVDGEWELDKNGMQPEYGIRVRDAQDPHFYGLETGNLPLWVREKLGLDFDASYKLADLNDDEKWNFKKIADWIEANL